MNFDEYQDMAIVTNGNENLWYHGLGLGGEAGEALEVLKKSFRPGRTLDVEALKGELGDVLWYLNSVATLAGLRLVEIAESNIKKIMERKAASPKGKMEGWK